MAWTVTKDWNYSTSGGAQPTLPVLNSANLVEKTSKSDGKVFVDKTSPIDRPNTVSVEWHQRSNIYQNTGIDRAFYAPSVRGFNVHLQENYTYKVDDGKETEFYAPISVGITIKGLMHEAITDTVISEALTATYARLFPDGKVTSDRIADLMRGALDLPNLK